MDSRRFDVAIIGGGIVGMATARALTAGSRLEVVVLEAEDHLAAHQSGHNSGVIHSGLYYKPGSLKARNCVEGRELMYRFCQEQGIPHERCGKVVVALRTSELSALAELGRRGRANGLLGVRELSSAEIREMEPHIAGIAGLLVPETGIVDYAQVTQAYARLFSEAGGVIQTAARVHGCLAESGGFVIETAQGDVACRCLVNCAGLQSDRVARLCGVEPGIQIVPFRGEYYELVPERRALVRNLVYPVPDPRFPFLGVHFTRTISGMVEAGPNAVLALRREGYRKTSFSFKDVLQMASYGGFWRMAAKYWRTGLGEFHRSLSRKAFHKALQRLLPELRLEDLRPAGAGVRAQALAPTGALVDDFRIVRKERMVHVLNSPSPAATASISIGRTIAAQALEVLNLPSSSVQQRVPLAIR